MKLLDFIREGMIDNEGEKNIKIDNHGIKLYLQRNLPDPEYLSERCSHHL